jgi:hypothetical protein
MIKEKGRKRQCYFINGLWADRNWCSFERQFTNEMKKSLSTSGGFIKVLISWVTFPLTIFDRPLEKP